MAEYSLKAVFGLDSTGLQTGIRQVRRSINNLVNDWGKWAALAGAAAFTSLAKGAIELAGKLSDTAANLRMNVESLQALEAQHKRNGVSYEQLVKALEKTKAAVLAAAEGDKKATEALNALGLSAQRLIRLPLDQQYEAIAKAAKNATDQNKAYAAVSDLLGEKVGPKLMGSLNELATVGLPGVTQAAKDAGQVMSKETIAALDRAGDAIDDFKKKATIAVGNIIVNFRSEEGIKLLWLQLAKVLAKFGATILQVPFNLGQVMAATLFGVFEASVGYLKNAGIEAMKAIGKAMNAILPERFEINIGNLDQFKSESKGFVDDIARNLAQTKPTALIDGLTSFYDDAITKQKAVVDALNKADFKPEIRALETAATAVSTGAKTLKEAGQSAGQAITDASEDFAYIFRDGIGYLKDIARAFGAGNIMGVRGGAGGFNQASDDALSEIIRRNRQQATELLGSGLGPNANFFNRQEAGRLQAEANNAQTELATRNRLRSAFSQGGEAGVFRAFPTTDPIILERMIDQFARNLDVSQKTQMSLETIENGLVARGIIRRV